MARKLTSSKAKEILRHGSVHSKPLTDKQKRFFGAVAGGAKPQMKGGGSLPKNIEKARKRPGGSNVGKKRKTSGAKEGPFVGPAGGAPKGSYPVTNKKQWRAAKAYARHAPNPAGIRAAADRIAKRKGWKKQYGGYLMSPEEYGLGGWLKDNLQGVWGGLKTAGGIAATIISGGAALPATLPLITSGIGDITGEVTGDIAANKQEDLYEQQMGALRAQKSAARQESYLNSLEGQSNNPYTPTFPMGGSIPYAQAEIEGGEVVQFPNGTMDRPKGPSHREGGINVTAQENTRVFSDELKYDKKMTYADKADEIKKQIEKYKKLLS